jgi:hypothetical protein
LQAQDLFPNREAYLRLITALAVEYSEEWIRGRHNLDMTKLGARSKIRSSEQNTREMVTIQR